MSRSTSSSRVLRPHLRQRKPGVALRRHRGRAGHLLEALQPRRDSRTAARLCGRSGDANRRRLLRRHPDADPQPPGERDLGLSERMRESVLPRQRASSTGGPRRYRARAVSRSRPPASPHTAGERATRELLARLADERDAPPRGPSRVTSGRTGRDGHASDLTSPQSRRPAVRRPRDVRTRRGHRPIRASWNQETSMPSGHLRETRRSSTSATATARQSATGVPGPTSSTRPHRRRRPAANR